jgi:hypothetical protein
VMKRIKIAAMVAAGVVTAVLTMAPAYLGN